MCIRIYGKNRCLSFAAAVVAAGVGYRAFYRAGSRNIGILKVGVEAVTRCRKGFFFEHFAAETALCNIRAGGSAGCSLVFNNNIMLKRNTDGLYIGLIAVCFVAKVAAGALIGFRFGSVAACLGSLNRSWAPFVDACRNRSGFGFRAALTGTLTNLFAVFSGFLVRLFGNFPIAPDVTGNRFCDFFLVIRTAFGFAGVPCDFGKNTGLSLNYFGLDIMISCCGQVIFIRSDAVFALVDIMSALITVGFNAF